MTDNSKISEYKTFIDKYFTNNWIRNLQDQLCTRNGAGELVPLKNLREVKGKVKLYLPNTDDFFLWILTEEKVDSKAINAINDFFAAVDKLSDEEKLEVFLDPLAVIVLTRLFQKLHFKKIRPDGVTTEPQSFVTWAADNFDWAKNLSGLTHIYLKLILHLFSVNPAILNK
jgi:hypothetical protein